MVLGSPLQRCILSGLSQSVSPEIQERPGITSTMSSTTKPSSSAISVIMPVLNMEGYLPRVLDGILMTDNCHGIEELIAIDNGSTDHSVAILESYANRFGHLRILHQPVGGSYSARNLGILHSRGDILLFLDSDCAPQGRWVSGARMAMRDPRIMLLLGHRNYAHQGKLLSLLAGYENAKARWMLCESEREFAYGYTNNMAVRRSVFDRLGLFEPLARGADTLFVQRLVSTMGNSVVGFSAQMEVDHLEVGSLFMYYKKRFIYGRSNSVVAQQCSYRPIPSRHRYEIYLAAIKSNRFQTYDSLLLLVLLLIGSLIYDIASISVTRKKPESA